MNRPFLALVRAALVLLTMLHVLLFLFVVLRRLFYPYDLEWMEGGMLVHAQRVLTHKPIYGPPTFEFTPFLYTPLYPVVVAGLGSFFGLSYLIGRIVSLVCLAIALVLGYRAARSFAADRILAAAAMAAALAAFPFTGAWYDLVRCDELSLVLSMAGLLLLIGKRTPVRIVLAAGLLSAAYFAKQTGMAFLVAGLMILLILEPRRLWLYALSAGALWAGPVLWLNSQTQGWFWNWCARAHARHPFYRHRTLVEVPRALFHHSPVLLVAGALALAVVLWRRALRPAQIAWLVAAAAGVAIACVGFGTAWASTNAYIPGVFFPLVAIAVIASGAEQAPRWIVSIGLAFHLGTHLYDPLPHIPTGKDRAAGDRLLARIAAIPGDVLIPYHPFYSVMAGKPAFVHQMALLDSPSAGFGEPRGLHEAVAHGRFGAIILDAFMSWNDWPTLNQGYELAETLVPGVDATKTFTGAPTIPRDVFRRREDAALWKRPDLQGSRAPTLPGDGGRMARGAGQRL